MLARPHNHDALGFFHMPDKDVFVLPAIAVLAADIPAGLAADLGDDDIGALRLQPGRTMPLEIIQRVGLIGVDDTCAIGDPRDIDAARDVWVGGPPIDW